MKQLTILLTLLLVPSVTAADPALVPITVATDGAADAINLAIREARFDGTAGEADALMQQLRAYARDFAELQVVPTSENLTAQQVRVIYAELEEFIALLGNIPRDLSIAESVGANCQGGGQKAALREVSEWTTDEEAARGRLIATADVGRALMAAGPALFSMRLTEALDRLENWENDRGASIDACLVQAQNRVGLTTKPTITVEAIPVRAYPGGLIRFIGWSNANAEVNIQGPVSARINTTQVFDYAWSIPTDAQPGLVSWTFSAGSVATTVDVAVNRAPSFIEAFGPRTILLGQSVDLTLNLSTPLGIGFAPSLVSAPGFEETVDLANPKVVRFTPTELGRYEIAISFEGGAQHRGASRSVTVNVIESWAGQPDTSDGFTLVLPRPSLGPMAYIAAIIAGVAVIAFLWRGRQRWASTRSERTVPHIGIGLTGAIGGLVSWMTATGRATPGSTAREVARNLASDGIPDEGLIEAFEAERYGNAPPSKQRTAGTQWAWKAIGALRRKK